MPNYLFAKCSKKSNEYYIYCVSILAYKSSNNKVFRINTKVYFEYFLALITINFLCLIFK